MDTTTRNTSFMEYLYQVTDASLTYIDNNDFTVTIVNVGDHCCRPLKVKCEEKRLTREKKRVSSKKVCNLFC